MSESTPGPAVQEPPASLSDQFSWIRTDLSNLRTLLSWDSISVTFIGFGFTIYNIFSGFLDEVGEARLRGFSRNRGLTLDIAGTIAMIIAVWNYWSINTYLNSSSVALELPRPEGSLGLRLRPLRRHGPRWVITILGDLMRAADRPMLTIPARSIRPR